MICGVMPFKDYMIMIIYYNIIKNMLNKFKLIKNYKNYSIYLKRNKNSKLFLVKILLNKFK